MSYKLFRWLFVLILIIGLAAIPAAQPVHAAGLLYVSTIGNDSNDCLSPSTACATINAAMAKPLSLIPPLTINVAVGIYTGISDEGMFISNAVTLSGGWNDTFTTQGGMSTIDGQGVRRGVRVNNITTIENFIIQNGFHFNNGGGIQNLSTLTLNNSIVRDNSTAFGGGILNNGTLTLNNSTVSGNSGTAFGGGILNFGTLTLNNSTISGNSGAVGGIANSGGALTLNNSTVNGNLSTGNGGGVLNAGGPTGTVTLNNTTVSGNSAIDSGGGIANFSGTGAVMLNYSTVTNNTSDSDNDGSGYGGGIFISNSNGSVNLQSSIVAGNKTGSSGVSDMTADCLSNGVLISQGYNLTGSGTGCDPLGGTGDVTVMPANVFTDVLGMLANNGGSTQTNALIFSLSNPAPNAIASGTNSCGSTPFDLDQRSVTRPQGTACDIGAFELEVTPIALDVTIDIKPGSVTNPINTKSVGTIPVAILSTSDFNAPSMVDRTSLTFGVTGDESSLAFCNNAGSDVNNDGLPDLVCHFYTKATGFQLGNLLGILKGKTIDGTDLTGSNPVKILK